MDADPALVPDIGRAEEAVVVGADQDLLGARRRLAPHRRPLVVRGVHREDLGTHPEGRDLPGLLLDPLGQRETDLAQARQRPFCHRYLFGRAAWYFLSSE